MRQWTIVTAIAVIAVFAAGWFLLVKPQKSKSTGLQSQATSQQQANQALQSQIAVLQQQEKNLPQQQAADRKFTTQVPDNAAFPTIIRQLSAAANGSGVDLVSMTPGTATPVVAATSTDGLSGATGTTPTTGTTPAPGTTGTTSVPGSTSLAGTTTPAGSLVELPIAIGITGSYPNIESFFQSLETLPRALLVTGWSLCQVKATGGSTAPNSSGGASCTPPTLPADKPVPANTLGGTLAAVVFYSPPAGAAVGTPGTTTSGTTGTTTTPTTTDGTTPAPTTSSAPTPGTTDATPAPGN
jgi:Tfp pilus assembly protein PilO